MSAIETACYSTPEESGLRVETLPFERIPQQSRLFLDYLKDPTALRRFYPTAIRFHHELSARAPEVSRGANNNRQVLCDAALRMNARGCRRRNDDQHRFSAREKFLGASQ